jgi:hypothetical protein
MRGRPGLMLFCFFGLSVPLFPSIHHFEKTLSLSLSLLYSSLVLNIGQTTSFFLYAQQRITFHSLRIHRVHPRFSAPALDNIVADV